MSFTKFTQFAVVAAILAVATASPAPAASPVTVISEVATPFPGSATMLPPSASTPVFSPGSSAVATTVSPAATVTVTIAAPQYTCIMVPVGHGGAHHGGSEPTSIADAPGSSEAATVPFSSAVATVLSSGNSALLGPSHAIPVSILPSEVSGLEPQPTIITSAASFSGAPVLSQPAGTVTVTVAASGATQYSCVMVPVGGGVSSGVPQPTTVSFAGASSGVESVTVPVATAVPTESVLSAPFSVPAFSTPVASSPVSQI